jgi:hypothetical protein
MMIGAANLLAEARRIPGTAGAFMVHPDWAPVAARIREAGGGPIDQDHARPAVPFLQEPGQPVTAVTLIWMICAENPNP